MVYQMLSAMSRRNQFIAVSSSKTKSGVQGVCVAGSQQGCSSIILMYLTVCVVTFRTFPPPFDFLQRLWP